MRKKDEQLTPSEQCMLEALQRELFPAEAKENAALQITPKLYEELKAQAVQSLLLDHLSGDLLKRTLPVVVHNVQLLYEQEQAVKLLEGSGIPVVVLKGFANAVNYPQALYRAAGDIDLWVGEGCFRSAYDCLVHAGYALEENQSAIDEMARTASKHIGFVRHGFCIELHQKPFLLKGCGGEDLEEGLMAYMEQGLVHAYRETMEGYTFPVLPPGQNALELLIHTQTHLRTGLGLRHVIDWMMFARRYMTDEQYPQYAQRLRSCGLEEFAAIMTRMCQLYLGMPENGYTWASRAKDPVCEALMHRILQFGNFGRKQEMSGGSRVFLRSPRQKLKMLQNGGLYNYREQIRRHPWMKHIAWALQLGRYIAYVRHNRGRLVRDYREARHMRTLLQQLQLFEEHE